MDAGSQSARGLAQSKSWRSIPGSFIFPPLFKALFAIDLRTLAVFRIALGLILLADIGQRLLDFHVFYTDEGVWPVAEALAEKGRPAGMWSLHLLSGAPGWQGTLFAIEGLAAAALVLGWRTRVAVLIAWLLLASVQSRNSFVLGGGEIVMRLLFFWALWLPLGARWSLDARREGVAREGVAREGSALSWATAGLLVQIAIIYVFNAIYKTDPAWRTTGLAISQVLSIEIYARPFTQSLLAWPELLRWLTRGIILLEAFGPLLPFIPWRNGLWRMLAVVLFIGFHAGLAATMRLGLFPYICMVGWLAFLPTELWERRLFKPSHHLLHPSSFILHPLTNAAAAFCLLFVVCWNLRTWWPWLTPKAMRPFAYALRLDQKWNMFSPRPWQREGWYVPVGTYAGGKEVDLLTGASPVEWGRPHRMSDPIPSPAWRKYVIALRAKGRDNRRRLYLDWLVRCWRSEHPDAPEFVKLELYYLQELIADRTLVPDNYLTLEIPDSRQATPVPAKDEALAP